MGDATKEAYFFLTPSRILKCSIDLGGKKKLGEQELKLSWVTKGTQVLLTTLWTPPESLGTSHWEYLACGLTTTGRGNHQCSMCFTQNTPFHGKIFCALGLEEFILLKCPYYLKQSTDLMQSLPKFQWQFFIEIKKQS